MTRSLVLAAALGPIPTAASVAVPVGRLVSVMEVARRSGPEVVVYPGRAIMTHFPV